MYRRYQPSSRMKAGSVARIVRDDYRSPEDWSAVKLEVLRRDRYCCTKCGVSVRGTNERAIHHIIPLSRGGRTVASNLTTLCDPCHESKHRHMATRIPRRHR